MYVRLHMNADSVAQDVYCLLFLNIARKNCIERIEMLTGIEPGMQMQIVTNDKPNPNPATNQVIERRQTTRAMYRWSGSPASCQISLYAPLRKVGLLSSPALAG